MILWIANLGFAASGQTGEPQLQRLITITGDLRIITTQEG